MVVGFVHLHERVGPHVDRNLIDGRRARPSLHTQSRSVSARKHEWSRRIPLSERLISSLIGRTANGVRRRIPKVPRHTVHSTFLVRRQLAHSVPPRIVDTECDISALRQRVAQEISDDGAEHRVRGRVLTIAKSAGPTYTAGNRAVWVVFRRGFYRKEIGAHPVGFAQLFKRRDVVDDVDTAAVGADYQVVLTRVDDDIVHGNGWNVVLELRQRPAAESRVEHSELRAYEEKVGLGEIFAYYLHRSAGGEIAANWAPFGTVIDALQNVRLEVIVAVIVESCVHGSFIEP